GHFDNGWREVFMAAIRSRIPWFASVLTVCVALVAAPAPVIADGHSGEPTATLALMIGEDPSLATLARAVEVAGLGQTLSTPGPFTVLAPTDEAFEALPSGALDDLLADPDQLKGLLLGHVLPNSAISQALVDGLTIRTVEGRTVDVAVEGESISIGGATVVRADIRALNGLIHVIDAVIFGGGAP
ncbi:MAG: fasciclin domain-containing protein, partial [Pseudomonadota bacterium]